MSADEATVPAVEATEPAVVEPTTVAGEKPAEEKPADEKAADSTPKVEAKTGKDASGEVPASTKPSILKTKAVMDYKEYKKNVKYDPSVLPETDDPLEILTQVTILDPDPSRTFLVNTTADRVLFQQQQPSLR